MSDDARSAIPRATMRLQFNKQFRFSHALPLVPYLANLGISHLYASPVLTAQPGSMHGYDVTDASEISPELGGESEFRGLVKALREVGLGVIVDIVPNHMAASHDNDWWFDVLRHGPASRFACYFDIDWQSRDEALKNKVLAPFLGKPYGQAIADGELRLEVREPTPVLRYYENAFPIDPATWDGAPLETFDASSASGRARLHALLERQHYRLAWWGTAADEINWRRFFDINGLVALRIEDPAVFEASHAKLFALYEEGLIDGFRIDHVDGLSDPPRYCRRLRARLSERAEKRPGDVPRGPAYVVVEKILGAGEAMPVDWEVNGTSGYDFMDAVSTLQHDAAAAPALDALWSSFTGCPAAFEIEETRARTELLAWNFNGQLDAVARSLHELARSEAATRDITLASIRRAVTALLAHFRVYRMYVVGEQRSASDERAFQHALTAAKAATPPAVHSALEQIDVWLGGRRASSALLEQTKRAETRFHQLSAPVAAKAVEDTAFYRYGRLLSRNDVGFNAAILGGGAGSFHAFCAPRAELFPTALLATATHDHKRGEDLRSRLAVLSEIPSEWEAAVNEWHALNQPLRDAAADVISPADELMLYQMIVGAWPNNLSPDSREGCDELASRLAGWLEKAQREAKLATSWTTPNSGYEGASQSFLRALFSREHGFLRRAAAFAHAIGAAGAVNSLAQVLLKMTAPGVPDFFQGTEFWDFSLVDPDNRRPVDFPVRMAALAEQPELPTLAREWRDGRVKQAVIAKALAARAGSGALFENGAYLPVAAEGARADRVVAFMRIAGESNCLIVVPRLTSPLLAGDDTLTFAANAWDDTEVILPARPHKVQAQDVLSGRVFDLERARVPVGQLLSAFPVAMVPFETK